MCHKSPTKLLRSIKRMTRFTERHQTQVANPSKLSFQPSSHLCLPGNVNPFSFCSSSDRNSPNSKKKTFVIQKNCLIENSNQLKWYRVPEMITTYCFLLILTEGHFLPFSSVIFAMTTIRLNLQTQFEITLNPSTERKP